MKTDLAGCWQRLKVAMCSKAEGFTEVIRC